MEADQQSPTTEQQQLEHEVLTPELVKDLIDLLKDPKPQVQHQTLNVILQYTTLSESKQKFKDTNLIELLIKNVFVERLTTVCLSNMINLSSEQCFYDKFASIIEPLIIQMQQWNNLTLELATLLLINLSKIEQCAEVIVGKEDKEGYCINILFGFLKTPKIGAYIANISSNITSFEAGRKLFAKNCIPLALKEHIFSSEREKRIGVVKTIRNTLFEWENEQFIEKLLKQQYHFINDFVLYWTFILLTSTQLVKDKYNFQQILKNMMPLQPYQQKIDVSNHYREKQLQELTLSIEVLLILTNVNFNTLKPVYKKEEFKELLAIISRIDLPEEERDKTDALNVFFC